MTDLTPRPERIGILLNPVSGYVRRHLPSLRRRVARIADATVIEASSAEQISDAAASLALGPADLLVVVGGDGTLQAVLTAMLRQAPLAAPYVLALPAGTTNMSAADLGIRANPIAALQGLEDWLTGKTSAPAVRTRAVLRVSDASLAPAQFGMFFGAGAIISGVRYFHSSVRPKGMRGALGPSLAFVRMLLSLLRSREHSLLPATSARLHLAPEPLLAPWLLILATTLDTLLLGSTPYWGREKAPMHFTAIAHRAPRLLRSLLFLLRGKSTVTMSNNPAYVSHNLSHTVIDDLTEYLLDGEIFSSRGQLHLSATPALRFIVL
ncbi:diacylglycerol/lipid kinase family protein [Pseudomonas veronii]